MSDSAVSGVSWEFALGQIVSFRGDRDRYSHAVIASRALEELAPGCMIRTYVVRSMVNREQHRVAEHELALPKESVDAS